MTRSILDFYIFYIYIDYWFEIWCECCLFLICTLLFHKKFVLSVNMVCLYDRYYLIKQNSVPLIVLRVRSVIFMSVIFMSSCFHAATSGPPFSGPAFSGPEIWSIIFRSCIFMPLHLVRHFQVLHFHAASSRPSFSGRSFSGRAFSCTYIWSVIFRSCFFMSLIFRGRSFSGRAFSVNPQKGVVNVKPFDDDLRDLTNDTGCKSDLRLAGWPLVKILRHNSNFVICYVRNW